MPKKKRGKSGGSRFGANMVNDVEKRTNEKSSNFSYLNLPKGLKTYKEHEGKVFLDFIPYIVSDNKHLDANDNDPNSAHVGNPWYKKPIFVHKNIGPQNKAIICPTTVGKKCPVCEERERQLQNGVDYKQAERKPQKRNLYLVVPQREKDYDEEIHLWDMSDYLFQEKLDDELRETPEIREFPDPEFGCTLKIRFSEEALDKNSYFEAARIDGEDRDEQYEESIMEEYNLDEMLILHSYKEIEAMYLADDDDEEEEEEEEETPKRRKKLSKKKQEEEEEEDDDEEEEPWDDDEEEEEEEEEDDDEEDDDEEDDDEEDEAPPKSLRKKKSAKKSTPPKKQPKKKRTPKDECPEGFDFGEDYDEYVECDDCPIRKACKKASA